jgi:F-type H+-transporting ATPase subunit a
VTTKRVLLLIGGVSAVLLIVGFVIGAVGSQMFGLGSPFVKQPGIHLPPDPVFPATVRQDVIGYRVADKKTEDHGASEAKEEGKEEHHGLGLMQFAVTNTMLSAWLTSIIMLVFFIGGARKPRVIPTRLQALIEMLFELVLNFASSILGPEMGRRAFPVVATIFFFVLFNAWIAIFLIPIYQAVGFGASVGGEFKLATHLVRPAGTDLNMPLALALVSFVFVEYWGFRSHGFGYLKKFFAFGDILRGRPSGLINVFVGLLELVSELVRIVSFTFRLFGNMTAGEILVVMITFLVPFVATQFVFGLELLVGLIQSVIFAGLTLVFLSVAVSHEEH